VHRPGRIDSFAATDVVTLDEVLSGWSVDPADLFRQRSI
jgi:hypothetical protein